MRESVLACRPLEAVRLLQMREPVAQHAHDRVDEIVYVVAGEGAIRLAGNAVQLRPATVVVVPHGSSHAFEVHGKKPLIIMSTLAGAACTPTPSAK
jgi:mannose-6-phosphate isomerase-like protein (cupin superfamily)